MLKGIRLQCICISMAPLLLLFLTPFPGGGVDGIDIRA